MHIALENHWLSQIGLLATLSPWESFCRKKMEHWGERSTDSVFKVKQRRKIRRFFQVHILFMVIYGQPSCFTTIAASYLHWGEWGGKRWGEGISKKKKKRKENESLQYHLKPLGVSFVPFFHPAPGFGVETYNRKTRVLGIFLLAVHPESKNILERKKSQRFFWSSGTGLLNRSTGHQHQGFIFEVNFQSR